MPSKPRSSPTLSTPASSLPISTAKRHHLPLHTMLETSQPSADSTLPYYSQVGAPPEVVDRLSAVAQELEMRQRASLICRDAPTDPELDQFMEAYHEMLVKYREELTRPLQEAMEFLRMVEAQLNSLSLTDGSLRILSAGRANTLFHILLGSSNTMIAHPQACTELRKPRDRDTTLRPWLILVLIHFSSWKRGEAAVVRPRTNYRFQECAEPRCEFLPYVRRRMKSLQLQFIFGNHADEKFGVCSSEDDQDGSGGETELPELDASAEDRELKHQLLRKYSGYLSSLRQELSKKKKKGKLPKDARQQLLNWWELHYKWPYPSETQKVALAESTGLDLKQINNWFINQRKRHWKPSEDMQFVVMDGYHAPNAALYMDGQYFMGDGLYRLGP
ncbi:hypothetical protein B296_00008236 [Ensete ventricosum]|uniref:Homeobox domain-containing protein n=1 Tax=Ensete ventricosum TaxID=4639 RepID=A0A426Z467_ENSVE|nr:hypothetical protein B296_00008236 [Ensete ventricosum]